MGSPSVPGMDEAASIDRAMRAAWKYVELGLVPLPSLGGEKKPALPSFRQYQEEPVPEYLYGGLAWETTNIQLMTGRTAGAVKIVVVDCDGEEARATWREWCTAFELPRRIWVVRTPSGGMHYYFRAPDMRVKTRQVWGIYDTLRGWQPHKEIKILGDGALAVAPPSFHAVHREVRYAFAGGFSPVEHPELDMAPPWVLGLPGVARPIIEFVAEGSDAGAGPRGRVFRPGEGIMDAIQDGISAIDKLSIAVGWGLRLASGGADGWRHCHAIRGEDARPSAGFHAETGRYKDHRTGECLTFFQLGAALGAFPGAVECARWCSWMSISTEARR